MRGQRNPDYGRLTTALVRAGTLATGTAILAAAFTVPAVAQPESAAPAPPGPAAPPASVTQVQQRDLRVVACTGPGAHRQSLADDPYLHDLGPQWGLDNRDEAMHPNPAGQTAVADAIADAVPKATGLHPATPYHGPAPYPTNRLTLDPVRPPRTRPQAAPHPRRARPRRPPAAAGPPQTRQDQLDRRATADRPHPYTQHPKTRWPQPIHHSPKTRCTPTG